MKQWQHASSIIEAYIRKCFLNLINPSIQTLQTLPQPNHEERSEAHNSCCAKQRRGEKKKHSTLIQIHKQKNNCATEEQ